MENTHVHIDMNGRVCGPLVPIIIRQSLELSCIIINSIEFFIKNEPFLMSMCMCLVVKVRKSYITVL